ncbi:hypothetical protein [Tenacibaculum agarivorans]|uniref:hypothetical protein n=1 Tax=Tenacibaculum agarivorans TaxID=1908389 RepID=UPI00094B7A2D|nr:hypothetical protein [Tenacibaculum agarivorans]
MNKISYKYILAFVFGVLVSNAQEKNYKEEFNVKSDVVIDINTRHSDIEIETWNKDKVVVEAYMMVEGVEVTEELKDRFYNKWDFDVQGNSKKITVKSRTNPSFDFHTFNFDNPDYSFIINDLSDYSIGSLDVLDSIDFIIPDVPPLPPLPELPPLPPLPPLPSEFDFKAYKKDKNYLEKWKKKNKDVLGDNPRVRIGKNSISIKSDDTDITMLKQEGKYHEEIKRARESYNKKREEAREEYKIARKEMLAERKEKLKLRKEEIKRRSERRKKERKEIQDLLKKRSKSKIKRFIKIRAPKNAKFNMNVKYGSLSFPK